MVKAPISHRTTTNVRWWVAGLLFLASALNYLDRQTMSVLASTIQTELDLTDVDYSYITSAFLLSYTIMYFVSGRLIDRFGTQYGFALSVGGWSAATMLHALAQTAGQLAGVRMLLGVFESANFPAGIRAVTEWFPVRERALAVGVFNAGASVGAALAVPLISLLALQVGWQYTFMVTGVLGFLWLIAWQRTYRLPSEHSTISLAELTHIADGQQSDNSRKSTALPLKRLLRLPEVWACIAARVLIDPVTYFLNFWIPKYLQTAQGFDLKTLGYSAWIPYAALALGTVAGGAVPGWLMGRGWSLHRARKTVMGAASVLIPIGYTLLTGANSAAMALAVIAGLMFCHGSWSNITLPTELFPPSVQGTVTGLGGTLGGLAGMVTQLAIGWAVQNLSYTPVFMACAMAYGLCFLIVHLTVRRIGVIITH